jgi:hypothetical protein
MRINQTLPWGLIGGRILRYSTGHLTARGRTRRESPTGTVNPMTLPNFIVIGPGKTGTTWLYHCLAAHPQIGLARHTKETVFFTEYYDRGRSWYERFFEGTENAVARGEVSNTYFFSPQAPARMAALLPGAKIIAFVRNPMDRILSAYLFHRRNGVVHGTFDEAIARDPTIVSNNFYDEHLERYLRHFPREQIFVALFDDIGRDPAALLRQIYEFLGVDCEFRPGTMTQRVLPASAPRNASLFHKLKTFARWLRSHNFHRFLSWAKANPILMAALTRPISDREKPAIPPATKASLEEIFRPHNARLAQLLSRDLSHWT